ncbi:hypothetical protein [Aquimarina agarivorans]|uniref:hypothetical protein n=1 Tax=Aquimarina agarivorans TaxID=980584 RepID=UPI000248E639|nr:hypothetical protein [Aquimarina agarivorans]
MKKLVILAGCLLTMLSCKNDPKTTAPDATETETTATNAEAEITLNAEFIHVADAAVLKGKDFIYGVVLDEKAQELSKKVAPLKKDEYDMVGVVVKGLIKPNPAPEGWEQVVEIKDIVAVLPKAASPKNENE